MNSLGNKLKNLRIEKNMYQKDIANLLNLSDVAYGYYESDSRQPNLETLKLLAKFYNVSTDYLLGLTDVTKPHSNENIDLSNYNDEDKKVIKYICKKFK